MHNVQVFMSGSLLCTLYIHETVVHQHREKKHHNFEKREW
jgi:hypothetical protein